MTSVKLCANKDLFSSHEAGKKVRKFDYKH